jgi:hypothetical protein
MGAFRTCNAEESDRNRHGPPIADGGSAGSHLSGLARKIQAGNFYSNVLKW